MDPFALDEIDVGDGIALRRFRDDDADKVQAAVMRNADHLTPFMQWMVPDYSLDMARDFISRSNKAAEAKELLGFGIYCTDVLIGSVGFVYFDWKAARTEIGYWIDRGYEGKGIVSKGCKALLDLAFNELELNRVEIRCSSRNVKSVAIPKRLGFKLEGHLRQSEFRNGEFHDFLIFGLLRSEWQGKNDAQYLT